MKIVKFALAAAVAFAPAVVFAQTSAPVNSTVKTEKHESINERKENQQDRIAQGVKAGTLSPAEAAKLEHQEAAINKEEAAMRAQNNGKLTKADRKLLQKQQNKESKRIYNTKHDLHGHK